MCSRLFGKSKREKAKSQSTERQKIINLYASYENIRYSRTDDARVQLKELDEYQRLSKFIEIAEELLAQLPAGTFSDIRSDVALACAEDYRARGLFNSKRFRPETPSNNIQAITDLSRAIELYEIAGKEEKTDSYEEKKTELYEFRGYCYLDQHMPDRAIEDANRIIKKSEYSKVYQLRGEAYYQLGMYNRAKADITYAMELATSVRERYDTFILCAAICKDFIISQQRKLAKVVEQYKAGKRDFQGVDLSWLDLSNINLAYADLRDANFEYSELSGSIFVGAHLQGANFSNCFYSGRVVTTNFDNANLVSANFRGAILGNARFRAANLRNAYMPNAALQYAYFEDADLTNAILSKANLANSTFVNCRLNQVDLSKSVFAVINLNNSELVDANLSNANLRQSTLVEANLERANLSRADLFEATITHSRLCDTNLSGAILVQLDLSDSDLTNANVANADIFAVNLTGANITNTNFAQAARLNNVFLPDTFVKKECRRQEEVDRKRFAPLEKVCEPVKT